MGSYLKAVLPRSRGGAAKYESVAVGEHELPHSVTAGGCRPGVCNTLASFLPTELALQTTGHDMKGQSSFYEYVDFDRTRCQAGATVLAGWPAFPWGRLGKGPRAASLEPIVLSGVSAEVLALLALPLHLGRCASAAAWHARTPSTITATIHAEPAAAASAAPPPIPSTAALPPVLGRRVGI